MIPNIIEFSVRNRFIVILLTAAVAVWGVYCVMKTPIDAIPDLSENQVIVFTDWMGRSPQEIDDQITYPLSVSLQGLSGVKAVRSSSEFNFSMISIIFDDKTDFYFARTRVLERLNTAATFLPSGVVPYMAPDATALGQIFWYTVEGDNQSVDELRAIQDWYVRYQLYVSGVTEVASVGGFVREYQVDVDPQKLRSYDIPLGAVFDAVARSNISVGGKVYFENNAEYLIRGVGWLRGTRDLENVVVAERKGVPIFVRNLATVQMGPEYRRSMLEKNGREAVGGVVMMRYGENPLAVTQAIKQRIEQLQPGLPEGVRIVPFYDRTSLIEGAIGTLKEALIEELVVASIAILLILRHLRSAFIVCATLPLAVLVAFIFMYHLGIPSNIMSLSGIAISVGLFVDAAVVMVENTTHELTARYGTQRIRGDITEQVVTACRLVGKPIFFAVMIMLVSFIPVFALGGMEGKMFHPLAFTKTFAMIGVSLVAITFVPAMIPLFVRGKLQRETDNWIVRSFIDIYKPVLTWLLKVPAAGIWFMSFLFIIGAALVGNRLLFLSMLVLALFFGTAFFRRTRAQALAFLLLASTALWAWHLPKLGREFMPPLDEGSILDMPVTVPRASITQAAEDVRVRDRMMASFPEVDQVVGKVGRADTPTDPSGIDMVETVVTLRPKEWWPKRKLRYEDALEEARSLRVEMEAQEILRPRQERLTQLTQAVATAQSALEELIRTEPSRERKLIPRRQALSEAERLWRELATTENVTEHNSGANAALTHAGTIYSHLPPHEGWDEEVDRATAFRDAKTILAGNLQPTLEELLTTEDKALVNAAAMDSVSDFDRAMRDLAHRRQVEHEPNLARELVRAAIDDLLALFRRKKVLHSEPSATQIERLLDNLVTRHGLLLVNVPRREEMTALLRKMADELIKMGVVIVEEDKKSELLSPVSSIWTDLGDTLVTATGREKPTVFSEAFESFQQRLDKAWKAQVNRLNWELDDRAWEVLVGSLLKRLTEHAKSQELLQKDPSDAAQQTIRTARGDRLPTNVFLWKKTKNDLVKEMDSELQVPGWGNIWTQPIINRVDMLATGVRTMIGVKVYGPRQSDVAEEITEDGVKKTIVKDPGIQTVANQIAGVLKGIRGAVDVFPDQIVGRSYLQIEIDREKSARYGVNVADITQAIEVAMGGKAITTTVEGRRRFPVRVRYAREYWQTQEALRRTLVTGRRGTPSVVDSDSQARARASAGMGDAMGSLPPGSAAMGGSDDYQIPISEVADIRVVEGPSVIKSENGMLRSYVQLNVRDRDIVGFVEEAQRAVADQVKLPPGFFIEWSGQFEHQVRARKTLQVIFPIVIVLMFVILYMTFNDVRDAFLVMLSVPGAIVGGIIFQSLFGFNFSVAVWVGYIACFGEATQTGIVMLVYLHEAIRSRGGLSNIRSLDELKATVVDGAVHRLRPKLMTEGVAIIGLMPMLWATGVGAEIMRPMAAPVLGGMLVADEVIDLLIPVIFNWYQARSWRRIHPASGQDHAISGTISALS